jgi:protein-S-isoprenylcysteine O-methyltransferase Ste14
MLNERYLWRSSHPSYLGLLIGSYGWDLAFRSWVGVLLTAALTTRWFRAHPSREALLRAYLGDEHTAYLTCEVIGVFAQSGQVKLVFDTRFYGDE